MPWEITYKSKWSGEKQTHVNTNNQSDAEGWARSLAQDNNCKVTCEYVHTGPHTDGSGRREHVVSVGNDS